MAGLSPVEEEPAASSSGRPGGGQGGQWGQQQQQQQGGQAGELPSPPGWGLQDNLDVIACRADLLYHRSERSHSVSLVPLARMLGCPPRPRRHAAQPAHLSLPAPGNPLCSNSLR